MSRLIWHTDFKAEKLEKMPHQAEENAAMEAKIAWALRDGDGQSGTEERETKTRLTLVW